MQVDNPVFVEGIRDLAAADLTLDTANPQAGFDPGSRSVDRQGAGTASGS